MMNEEIPDVNLTEKVCDIQPRTSESPRILLASNPTAETRFDLENIKKCLNTNGVWCSAPDHYTMTTLLHGASGFGEIEAVKFLIEVYGVDANIKDRDFAPLHNAVQHNHYATAELLIKHGASVNIEDSWGFTPLHEAAKNKNMDMYNLLLKHGGDEYKKNKSGDTPHGLINPLYEASKSSQTSDQVHLQMENQSSTSTVSDLEPRHLHESYESSRNTVRPDADGGKISSVKGRETKTKRQHPYKQNEPKRKKTVILTRRERALLRKILHESCQGNQDFTQYSPRTKRERMLLKIHLKKCADSNKWKIVNPHANDGSHKPPETGIATTACMPSVTNEDMIVEEFSQNVVLGDNLDQSKLGTCGGSGTGEDGETEPVFETSTMRKYDFPEEGCTQFSEQQCVKSDISENEEKMAVLKNEFRKVREKNLFVRNLRDIVRAHCTPLPELPDQHSDQKAQPVPSHSLADVESGNLEHKSEMASLLPDFGDLGLEEEERDNNSETGIKNTISKYLMKKGSSG